MCSNPDVRKSYVGILGLHLFKPRRKEMSRWYIGPSCVQTTTQGNVTLVYYAFMCSNPDVRKSYVGILGLHLFKPRRNEMSRWYIGPSCVQTTTQANVTLVY